MIRLAPILFIVLAQGCASAPIMYSQPRGDSGRYAQITIINASTQLLSARLYEDSISCSRPVFLTHDLHAFPTGPVKTIQAEKGKPVTIGAWYITQWTAGAGGLTSARCDLNTTFVPRTDRYWVIYSADDSVQRCGVQAQMEQAGQRQMMPEGTLLKRPFHLAFLQEGPWCTALSDEQLKSLDKQ